MNTNTKMIHTMKVKTKAVGDGLTRVVASTPDVDRFGDIVASSWNEKALNSYRKNAVVIWGHDYQIPSIGRAESVQVVDGELIADIRFDDSPENDLGRLIKSQFERGFLNSVSVGFRPGTATPRSTLPDDHPAKGEGGYFFEDSRLLEISVVNIPANPHALARRAIQAELWEQKHIMQVVEGDDSWTVTFHKYDGEDTEEEPEEAPEVEESDDPYADTADSDEAVTMSQAREIIRDTIIEILGQPERLQTEENETREGVRERTTRDHHDLIRAIADAIGY